MAKLPEKGLVGLGFWENGFRQISNNRHPINKAEDISGLKLRVIQNPLFIDTFKAFGANALPMPFPEVYTALETGTVDGQENPLTTLITSKFYEVQKHTVISNHIYSVWAFLISKKFWDKLSPDEQKILTEAANEATAFERKTIRAFDATALGSVRSRAKMR
jgi:tripartite ATP-independent transporter DctP family solute receptor